MFTKRILGVLVGCIVLSTATGVAAWDGKRKGFILGGGIGPGMTSFTQKVEYGAASKTSPLENKFGLQTDFKIGGAPTDLIQIYYTNKVSWFGIENIYGNDVIIASGLSAVGVSYYSQPESPSSFFSGGLGFSSWAVPEEEANTWIGFGFYAGVGYEFARYWNVEFDLVWGNPSEEEAGLKATTNAFTYSLMINVLGY